MCSLLGHSCDRGQIKVSAQVLERALPGEKEDIVRGFRTCLGRQASVAWCCAPEGVLTRCFGDVFLHLLKPDEASGASENFYGLPWKELIVVH